MAVKGGMACRDVSSYDSFLNEVPTLEELTSHINVGTDWKKFGAILGIDVEKLNTMPDDKSTVIEKMFQLWLSSGPNATRKRLLESLKRDSTVQHVAHNYDNSLKEIYQTSCKFKLFLLAKCELC